MTRLLYAVPLLLAGAAAAQPTGSATMPPDRSATTPSTMAPSGGMAPAATSPMAAGGNAGAGGSVTLSSADKKFIEKAAEGGLAEVQLAQLAQTKATDQKVKDFAQQMITDHTQANQKLVAIAQAKGVTPPTTLTEHHQDVLQKLQNADGAKFDKMYLRGQVHDHQEQLELMQKEAKNGADTDLKQFAATTAPVVQQHLDMAKQDQGK